jgi:signal transduction histidine kinase
VLVCVDDDGPGIPPELMERLFTPFARVGTPSGPRAAADDAAKEESIGLGLGLARGLAVAMRGDLVVGRSGQEGTSMHLRLPCATTTDSALPDGSSSRG